MRRSLLVVVLAALPLTLCVPVLHAQGPAQAIDASKMPESGPAIVGGSGATAGPNSKNQAIMPMPGVQQDEQLSELPRDAVLTPPNVRPVPGSPRPATPRPATR